MSADKNSLQKLILVFIMAVVGLVFTPSIQTEVTDITQIDPTNRPGYSAYENRTGIIGNNLSSPARNILALFPLFWVIILIAIPVYHTRRWLTQNQ
jgi:hypothetical protein